MTVKCVIWDLDNTLLAGVYLEEYPDRSRPRLTRPCPGPRPRCATGASSTRSPASNPPEAAQYAAGGVTGLEFAAAECGWGRKSDAVRRIIADLNLGPDAIAFVDDDPYERAEVSFAEPQVLVLSPEDMADAVGWPEFSPPAVTAEARRRNEMYAERRRREQEARTFAGSRDEFLRYCGTRVTIARAGPTPTCPGCMSSRCARTSSTPAVSAWRRTGARRRLVGSAEQPGHDRAPGRQVR